MELGWQHTPPNMNISCYFIVSDKNLCCEKHSWLRMCTTSPERKEPIAVNTNSGLQEPLICSCQPSCCFSSGVCPLSSSRWPLFAPPSQRDLSCPLLTSFLNPCVSSLIPFFLPSQRQAVTFSSVCTLSTLRKLVPTLANYVCLVCSSPHPPRLGD